MWSGRLQYNLPLQLCLQRREIKFQYFPKVQVIFPIDVSYNSYHFFNLQFTSFVLSPTLYGTEVDAILNVKTNHSKFLDTVYTRYVKIG